MNVESVATQEFQGRQNENRHSRSALTSFIKLLQGFFDFMRSPIALTVNAVLSGFPMKNFGGVLLLKISQTAFVLNDDAL